MGVCGPDHFSQDVHHVKQLKMMSTGMKKYASHIGGHAGLLKALPQTPEAAHVCSGSP